MHIESKSGGTCFVATAAYQDPQHPDVVYLRNFRDRTLVRYEKGRAFISWYWKIGPKLAQYLYRHPPLRMPARYSIGVIVCVLKIFRSK
ncbi:hypothetical protein D3C76_1552110 [compost metagenome]